MKNFTRPSINIFSIIALLVISGVLSACATSANRSVDLTDESIIEYVHKASGIIYAPRLTRGTLFQMQGAFGRAKFTRKTEDSLWCDVASIRIIFGDFSGSSTGFSRIGSVVLLIMNPSVAEKLANGIDIVSEDVTLMDVANVSTQGLNGVDILVYGSASANSGFVLNPGSSILNDIFGASSVGNDCKHPSSESALKGL